MERCKLSLYPIGSTFAEKIKDKPDLYGPFWLMVTLVFALIAAGNMSSYIKKGSEFEYDYTYIDSATSAVIILFSNFKN